MARGIAAVAAGIVGGLVGTWVMSEVDGWWSRAVAGDYRESAGREHDARGWQERSEDRNANEIIAQRIAARTIHRRLTRGELTIAAPAVHYAFGAAMGAVYGAIADRLPQVAPLTGIAWGVSVWIAADEIAIPALNLDVPDQEYPMDAHLQSLATHIVYGVSTAAVYRVVRQAFD